ncbi:septal ring lytic transglycosylase RlpA family protein [Candidatus Methylacidithermus pantelleriae]|uniref:Probable endolytic peptidoglycan transglycosylase RlpA n=1 Tax=Candidatus Methylacidithermus pantelleriae TaxID=2744239 RepID=A0A8J2BS26_9BACT|nr:septal ring lytic transglycosylase RlpA family protein [Candidatus Methylacidithermus pantelleriae]CAF0703217.1 putative endolytic peptidoglycan transglycosylase RlpA [Candidatus Methylacidithermus pantelleriae]
MIRILSFVFLLLLALFVVGCAGPGFSRWGYHVRVGATQRGYASWYGGRFHGKPTADGGRYNQWAHTAAHRHLPFGTVVRVRNLLNGKQAVLRITDRGPFVKGRIIDVSLGAARELGMVHAGVVPVEVRVLRLPSQL